MFKRSESKVLNRGENPKIHAVYYITAGQDKPGLDVRYINSFKGRGVFALSALAKGEFVLECRGQLINSKERERRRRIYHPCVHAFMFDFLWHGELWSIDAGFDDCSLGRLVNDDPDNPNCKLKRIFVAGKPHLCLFALRAITHGEEITYKYKYGDFPWRTQWEKCEKAAGTNRLESDGSSADDRPDTKCSRPKSPSHIQDQASSKADTWRFISAILPCNKHKNQLVNTVPLESPHVCWQQVRGLEGPDSINISFSDGHRLQKAYTITRDPLTETTKDLCKMLCQHISTTRVKPIKLCKTERETCCQYWPVERAPYQCFARNLMAKYHMTQYILREFKIADTRDALSWMSQQFKFTYWPKQEELRTDEAFNNVIDQVYKTKVQFNQDGPVTVQCSMTEVAAPRCSSFALFRNMLKAMVMELFLMFKTLHIQRPAVVLSEDQYQRYRAALKYLERFLHYAA